MRLKLGGFGQAAAGLCKLEVRMAVTRVATAMAAVKVVAVRLDLGSVERAALTLRELEAKLGFVVLGRAVAKLHLAVAAVLSLAGLEQAAAKLNAGDFEWATAGLGELGTRAMLLEKQCQQG